MATGGTIVDRIITAITIQVQAVYGFWVQVGGIVGADEAAPFGAIIPGIAVIEASIISTIMATEPKKGCFGDLCFSILILPSSPPAVKKKPPRP